MNRTEPQCNWEPAGELAGGPNVISPSELLRLVAPPSRRQHRRETRLCLGLDDDPDSGPVNTTTTKNKLRGVNINVKGMAGGRKGVRFHPTMRVRSVESASLSDKSKRWYSREECSAMTWEAIESIRRWRVQVAERRGGDDSEQGWMQRQQQLPVPRGLERMLSSEHARQRKARREEVLRAVMDGQNWYRRGSRSRNSANDDRLGVDGSGWPSEEKAHSIALACMKASELDRYAGERRGKRDAMEAAEMNAATAAIASEIKEEEEEKMLTAAPSPRRGGRRSTMDHGSARTRNRAVERRRSSMPMTSSGEEEQEEDEWIGYTIVLVPDRQF